MPARRAKARPKRIRIGRVSLYEHHGNFWLYYRRDGVPQRRRVGADVVAARQVAADINADLERGALTMFDFRPITVAELIAAWLDFHEHVARSSVGTVSRYRAAVAHLSRFLADKAKTVLAHQVDAIAFAKFLRAVQVASNGHRNARRRPLRDKGVIFILETCRAMLAHAARQRRLPPYFDNPFTQLRLGRLPIEDAKAIHVFSADEEVRFLTACDDWLFPIFYTLAKTGMRPGELTHLLVEDVDVANGLLHIHNKPELGWSIKTRNTRTIPLPAEPMAILRHVVGDRAAGVLFQRRRFRSSRPPLDGLAQTQLAKVMSERVESRCQELGRPLARHELARVAATVWRDAGAIKPTVLRVEFMRLTRQIGLPEVTAPKSWRHTFATLMQQAGVDPLIRQQTMGHVPAGAGRGALGMTSIYTHTDPHVHRQQLARVIELRPLTSDSVANYLTGSPVSQGENRE